MVQMCDVINERNDPAGTFSDSLLMFLSPPNDHFCFSPTDDRLPSGPGGLFYKPIKRCKHTGALNYSHNKTLIGC